MSHVSEAKKNEVRTIKELFNKYKIISIGDLTSLPSKQLQEIRSKLKNSVLIKVTKKRLIKKAIEEFKDKDLSKLNNYLDCMPILLFSNEDPFKLYRLLKKSRSKAAIKAGQIAPYDLIVKEGPTNFQPGPIIGELGQAGIIAGVEQGKVVIKKEKVVVKRDEVVNQKVADILAKLGEEPMEIGLSLKVVYDNGMLYDKDVLDIDEEQLINNLKIAYSNSLNLAVKINYITKETIKVLIRKAVLENNILENNEKVKKALETIGSEENIIIKSKEEKQEEKSNEKIAKEIIQKMQDNHIRKQEEFKKHQKERTDEKVAKDVIQRMQDNQIKKEEEKKLAKRHDNGG